MPDSWTRTNHFVTHKPEAVISRIGLDLVYYRPCVRPSHDGRLHPNCRGHRAKIKRRIDAGYAEWPIGNIVIHVALTGMCLAPGVFVGADVCRFAKIGRTWIQACIQVRDVHADPVRNAVVTVAAVIVGG